MRNKAMYMKNGFLGFSKASEQTEGLPRCKADMARFWLHDWIQTVESCSIWWGFCKHINLWVPFTFTDHVDFHILTISQYSDQVSSNVSNSHNGTIWVGAWANHRYLDEFIWYKKKGKIYILKNGPPWHLFPKWKLSVVSALFRLVLFTRPYHS